MKIIAVDDEIFALRRLEKLIKEAEETAEVFSTQYADKALEYARKEKINVAFLDIQMMDMDGIELAKRLKRIQPECNVVFVTGFSEYALEAYQLDASGYLMKPATVEDVRHQLHNLRYAPMTLGKPIRVQCFGNFQIYIHDEPVKFKYDKTRELLAYLVDRHGTMCTNKQIMAALWEDDNHASYLRMMLKDLIDTFKNAGFDTFVIKQRGKVGLDVSQMDCDYYDWEQGLARGINAYQGEYMAQYTWAEYTNGTLGG